MSYILDALKKSEEQRNPGHATIPRPQVQPTPHSRISYYIIALIVLGLIFFALAALYLQQQKQQKVPNSTDIAAAAQRQSRSTISAATTESQPINKQAPLYQLEPTNRETNDKPFADAYTNLSKPLNNDANRQERLRESHVEKYQNIANLSESDIVIQNKIPNLNYSSHWFDENAKKSTIIINNQSLKESDWINNTIQVKKILSEESVFEIEDRHFKLRSLQSWSP